MSVKTRAIVARCALQDGGWSMEEVSMAHPKAGELLVEIVGTGICHTDIQLGSAPEGHPLAEAYPRILGHEGSGYVREVGPGVTIAKVGDAVVCSYASCEDCHFCNAGDLILCQDNTPLNLGHAERIFDTANAEGDSTKAAGSFFGQSSFANLTLVKQSSIVNVQHLVRSKEELQLFSPLGCGIQTGAGTVIKVAQAKPNDIVCVLGMGGVGLSAVMAAKLLGCRQIIGIDRVKSRLSLAKELGCTDVVDTSNLPPGQDLVTVVQAMADTVGPTIVVEATGVAFLRSAGMELLRKGGKFIQVALPSNPAEGEFKADIMASFTSAKSWVAAIEGWCNPRDFVPQLIAWYREGKLPFDKFVKFFPAEDFATALEEMKGGNTIKPVLRWPAAQGGHA